MVVLATSEKGVCYVWNFESVTDEAAKPIKISVKPSKGEMDERAGRAKKNLVPIIAARLHALDRDSHLRAVIAYGSVESPEFTSVDVSSPGEDIVITAGEQTEKEVAAAQANGHAKKGVVNITLCFPVFLWETQPSLAEVCVNQPLEKSVSPPSPLPFVHLTGQAVLSYIFLNSNYGQRVTVRDKNICQVASFFANETVTLFDLTRIFDNFMYHVHRHFLSMM